MDPVNMGFDGSVKFRQKKIKDPFVFQVRHEILGGEFHFEKYESVVGQITESETCVLRGEKPVKSGFVSPTIHLFGNTQNPIARVPPKLLGPFVPSP